MNAWNRAIVTFHYFEKSSPSEQRVCSATVLVFGKPPSSVIQKLFEICPYWKDFSVIELSWQ